MAVDSEIVQEILYRYGALQHWDVAVMLGHGLTKLISTDRHFDQVAGVKRLDPEDLWKQAVSHQASRG